MNRKSLALAVVLLLAGLAPASAIIGFCTRMPCCHHAAARHAAIGTTTTDCCTTIACYESPSARIASPGASLSTATIAAMAVAPLALAPSDRVAGAPTIEPSPPPPTGQRLAILSTLLI